MKAYTEAGLLAELAELKEQVSDVLARVQGRLFFESSRHASEQARNHSALHWIHLAHRGTLEKIPDMLAGPGPHGTMELLATTRNVFENQVWVRLMSKDTNFGIVFYAHLLAGQMQHCKSYIDKLTDDAGLFDTAGEIDMLSVDEAVAIWKAMPVPADKKAMSDILNTRTKMLDAMMRDEFALYSDYALTRGYNQQAFLIREHVIPHFQAELAILESYQAALKVALPSLLSPYFQNLANAKWNWVNRARDVLMEKSYRFIYSLTSRLLHSYPVNIITDKDLNPRERILVLNYSVVACRDILKIIEQFSHPEMVNAAVVP